LLLLAKAVVRLQRILLPLRRRCFKPFDHVRGSDGAAKELRRLGRSVCWLDPSIEKVDMTPKQPRNPQRCRERRVIHTHST
jgi:hypothetical protein